MTNSQNEFWSRAGEEFQENLAKSWGQAMQTFQTMDLGGIVPPAQDAVPQLTFSQEKLKELQAAYLEEATALWNHGLESKHEMKDRRFSSEALICSMPKHSWVWLMRLRPTNTHKTKSNLQSSNGLRLLPQATS
jgi:hypothetical protein